MGTRITAQFPPTSSSHRPGQCPVCGFFRGYLGLSCPRMNVVDRLLMDLEDLMVPPGVTGLTSCPDESLVLDPSQTAVDSR